MKKISMNKFAILSGAIILAIFVISLSANHFNGNVIADGIKIKENKYCNDSDKGIFLNESGKLTETRYSVKGTILFSISHFDSCMGEYQDYQGIKRKTKVIEYFCDKGKTARTVIKTCVNGCEDGACVDMDLICSLETKSGLCGQNTNIFPLNNLKIGEEIQIYNSGKIVEDNNFRITLDSPPYLKTNNAYELKIIIKNKLKNNASFNYNLRTCNESEACNDLYGEVGYVKIPSKKAKKDKLEYLTTTFKPLEEKRIVLKVTPKSPTLVKTPMSLGIFQYYAEEKRHIIYFKPQIKVDENYLRDPYDKHPQGKILRCGGLNYPSIIEPPRYIEGGNEDSYSYNVAKCCDNKFYPSAECCTSKDCKINKKCIDGKCMAINRGGNKLIGTKRILVAEGFNIDNTCKILPSSNSSALNEINLMERFYDFMALQILGKPSNFVDFNVSYSLLLPNTLVEQFGATILTEKDLINYIESNCNISTTNVEIIILPTAVSIQKEFAGMVLNKGEGKVILYQNGNPTTLIHETGHLFGCSDLYTTMGGHLQWSSTIYGDNRQKTYDLIMSENIEKISVRSLDVCRGELGWVDINGNGIIDIEEKFN